MENDLNPLTGTQGMLLADQTREQFLHFLNTFYKTRESSPDDLEPYYFQSVRDMCLARDGILNIDFGDVLHHGQGLADTIRTHFYTVEAGLRAAVRAFVNSVEGANLEDADSNADFYIKFFNLPEREKLRCTEWTCTCGQADCLWSPLMFCYAPCTGTSRSRRSGTCPASVGRSPARARSAQSSTMAPSSATHA